MGKRVVIALGGNAIKQPDERGTEEEHIGEKAIITSLERGLDALGGKAGITIIRG